MYVDSLYLSYIVIYEYILWLCSYGVFGVNDVMNWIHDYKEDRLI